MQERSNKIYRRIF